MHSFSDLHYGHYYIIRQPFIPSGIFSLSFFQSRFLMVSFICFYSSPPDLLVGRGLRPARPRPQLGRWAAASPARRLRPLWLLRSSPPSTPLETLRRPSPARSASARKNISFAVRSVADLMFYSQCEVRKAACQWIGKHVASSRYRDNSISVLHVVTRWLSQLWEWLFLSF